MPMNAMPLLIAALAFFALAYRFYFSFVAAKIAVINDMNVTPAHRLYDGQNYYPMNKWVFLVITLRRLQVQVRSLVQCSQHSLVIFPVSSGWLLAR